MANRIDYKSLTIKSLKMSLSITESYNNLHSGKIGDLAMKDIFISTHQTLLKHFIEQTKENIKIVEKGERPLIEI